MASIQEKLLRCLVHRSVSEKLGTLFRELGDITGKMTTADAKAAKLMIIEMVASSSTEFCAKMKDRIEKQELQPE